MKTKMENIFITNMNQETAKQVADIEKICFSSPWTYTAFLNELTNPISHTMIATKEGQIIGFINVYLVLDEGNINNVAVLPEFRGHGIGRLLINSVIALCRSRQISRLMLEVRESNLPALSLYRKLGFQKVGLRKNFYSDPIENAILMTKEITLESDSLGRSSHENISN